RDDHARLAAIEARVVVARPVRAPAGSGGVTLPGSVLAVQEAQIYPRTSGYLRSLAVDLGDAVTAGQALAVIDNPEVDQELRQVQAAVGQARAALQQARTQLTLARAEATRYGALVTRGYASEQETTGRRAQAEVAEANVAAAQAALASNEANARRLQELKGYATLRAPFDGVITARSVEVGQLVTAGSAAGQALLRVSKTDVVRVMVNVPQMYAPGVRAGASATVRLREYPGRSFAGTVTRTAGALDAATRTLLTEVRVPNADRALLAGMYAQLTLALAPTAPLYVPATALVAGAEGTRVAVVEGGVIRWRVVQIDGDLGDRVAVATGLGEGDRVVVTPSDRLVEGMRVRAEMAAPAPARR
ncbi:MAG: efflux RND transporter periplasmic adaptor subunit, partial [Deltaproteobacteria bacterium]|nr:efflux RND transporter periplasmic adaptor subunit [Deltaproteobacteria bacterium]